MIGTVERVVDRSTAFYGCNSTHERPKSRDWLSFPKERSNGRAAAAGEVEGRWACDSGCDCVYATRGDRSRGGLQRLDTGRARAAWSSEAVAWRGPNARYKTHALPQGTR